MSNASTFVFVSSKLTTASAFSRLTSALLTPSILVNDLFTEITQNPHVIPVTESVTVLISANAAVANSAAAMRGKKTVFLMSASQEKRCCIGERGGDFTERGSDPQPNVAST